RPSLTESSLPPLTHNRNGRYHERPQTIKDYRCASRPRGERMPTKDVLIGFRRWRDARQCKHRLEYALGRNNAARNRSAAERVLNFTVLVRGLLEQSRGCGGHIRDGRPRQRAAQFAEGVVLEIRATRIFRS